MTRLKSQEKRHAYLPLMRLIIMCIIAFLVLRFYEKNSQLTCKHRKALGSRLGAGICTSCESYYKEMCTPVTENRAVAAPEFYPIPRFLMSLGDDEKPCRFLPDCHAFSKGELEWPEAFIIQSLIALLGHCPFGTRACYMADFGGNLGYVNSYAAALGASVVSIEPQQDLWKANVETIKMNCWDHRVTNLNGMVTLDPSEHGTSATISRLWRPGMVDFEKKWTVRKHWIGNMLALNPDKTFDLIKIDVDSIDEKIIDWILDRVGRGELQVTSIIIEFRGSGKIMHKASQLGYTVYQLDHHLRLRFFDHRGADVYKLRGCPAPVAPYRQEQFCRRGIQYMMKMTAGSEDEWTRHIDETLASRGTDWKDIATSWLFTRANLSRPSIMESWSKSRPSPYRGNYRNNKLGFPGEPQNPNPIEDRERNESVVHTSDL